MRQALWVIGCLLLIGWSARARAADDAALGPLYERIVQDVQQGRPLRVRVYVALCDNASQGIVPVKNPAICDGDVPERNIYWGTRGGLSGFMRTAGFRLIESTQLETGPIAVRAVWRKRMFASALLRGDGPRSIDVELEGLAYRGREIRSAMLDFVRAVHSDDATPAGTPHIVTYVGHNYFLDTSKRSRFSRRGARGRDDRQGRRRPVLPGRPQHQALHHARARRDLGDQHQPCLSGRLVSGRRYRGFGAPRVGSRRSRLRRTRVRFGYEQALWDDASRLRLRSRSADAFKTLRTL